jgi:hypothetical protein
MTCRRGPGPSMIRHGHRKTPNLCRVLKSTREAKSCIEPVGIAEPAEIAIRDTPILSLEPTRWRPHPCGARAETAGLQGGPASPQGLSGAVRSCVQTR